MPSRSTSFSPNPRGKSTGVGADHVPFAFVCTTRRERPLSP